MAKEVIISIYPDTGDIRPEEREDIHKCREKMMQALKAKTGIDFELTVVYCPNTDERYVEAKPDIVDDEIAKQINGLTVSSGEIEMEVTAEFPPDYIPPSLRAQRNL